MNVQKAIELCNTFNDDLRKCEKCKCDGTDESIEK
jgi:hypothetical protein